MNKGTAARVGLASAALFLTLAQGVGTVSAPAGEPLPEAGSGPRWRVHSLLEVGRLRQRNIFQVAFEKDGTAWLATSDGLYRYDGYDWARFALEDGLPSSFIRCVLIDRRGRKWIGTDRGAGVFDGRQFHRMGSDRGLPGPSVRRIREDPDGTLWFCCDRWPDPAARGGLACLREGVWNAYTESEDPALGYPMDYFRDSTGRQFVLTQTDLLEKAAHGWSRPLIEVKPGKQPETFWSIAEVPGVGVMVSTFGQVYVSDYHGWRAVEAPFPTVLLLGATRQGEFFAFGAASPAECRFRKWNGTLFDDTSEGLPFPAVNVVFIEEAPDGSIWSGGYDYLVRWDRTDEGWTLIGSAMPAPAIVDPANRVWFAARGGASRWNGKEVEPIADFSGGTLALGPKGEVWGWQGDNIWLWSGGESKRFDAGQSGVRSPGGCAFDARGRAWFHSDRNDNELAISVFDGQRWQGMPSPPYRKSSVNNACPDPQEGMWYMIMDMDTGTNHLTRWREGGIQERSIVGAISPYSRVQFTLDRQGNGWLFGGSIGLYRASSADFRWEKIQGLLGANVSLQAQSSEAIWFGMNGFTGGRAGLAVYSKGQLRQHEAEVELLVHEGVSGNLYWAGNGVVHIVPPSRTEQPLRLSLPLEGQITGIVEDRQGSLWLGVGRSVLRYEPRHSPVRPRIRAPTRVRHDGRLPVQLGGLQRFQDPGRQPESFRFSYRVDGGAWSGWEMTSAIEVPAQRLAVGDHVLEVRAQSVGQVILGAEGARGRASESPPVSLSFAVTAVPLQERLWFGPAVAVAFVTILAMAGQLYAAGRKLAAHARNLEGLVAQRTASIKESEQKLRAIFNQTFQFSGLLDPNGTVLAINEPALKYAALRETDAIGLPYWETAWWRHSPELRGRVQDAVKQAAAGQFVRFEATMMDASGHARAFDFSLKPVMSDQGRIAYLIPEARDMTAIRQAEEVLRAFAQRQKLHFEQTPLAVIEWGTDLRVVQWNPAATLLFGFTPEEALGRYVTFILPPPAREEGESVWRALLLKGGNERWTTENVRKDGERILCEWYNTTLVDAQGDVMAIASLVQDITQRTKAEEERLQLERRLLHAQKLESLGVLAGGIAHDFNNLLAAILGNLQLAIEDLSSTSSARSSIQEAIQAAKRAADLTRQMLAYSGRGQFVITQLNLSLLVEELAHMLRAVVPRTVTLDLHIDPRIPTIAADEGQAQQVVMNLITNAAEAIGGQTGVVRIATGVQQCSETDLAESRLEEKPPPGAYAFIEVSDTGCGMDAETQRRLFDPFFTTKFTGRGLGMSAVLGIVRGHSGAIFVRSQVGHGTTVRVLFPATTPSAGAAAPAQAVTASAIAPPAQLARGGVVLVVDDEPAVRHFCEKALQRMGLQCLLAADGEEAIDVLRCHLDHVDCVLLDLTMPRKDGLAAFLEMRKLQPDLRTILCSGFSEQDAVQRFAGYKLAGFLQKPYDIRKLRSAISNVLQPGIVPEA